MKQIKAKTNDEDRAIVTLYGKEFDVTDEIVDGKATINAFGETYEVLVKTAKKALKKFRVINNNSVTKKTLETE